MLWYVCGPLQTYIFTIGLYYKSEAMEDICFEPNDSNCIEANPVPCPTDEVEKHEAEIRANALAQSNTCQEICNIVDSCREDPQAHGSYCKFEDVNPLCFGMSSVTHYSICSQVSTTRMNLKRRFVSNQMTLHALSGTRCHAPQSKSPNKCLQRRRMMIYHFLALVRTYAMVYNHVERTPTRMEATVRLMALNRCVSVCL